MKDQLKKYIMKHNLTPRCFILMLIWKEIKILKFLFSKMTL